MVWGMVVPECSSGRESFLPFLQRETGLKRDRTAQRGRPPVILHALARMRAGLAQPSGRILGERCWPLLAGLWRAIAPLMQPWCCYWLFCAFWFLLGALCIWRVLALLGSLLCTRLGLLRCASCWTRPLGGGRWGHYLCNLWGDYLNVHKTAYKHLGMYVGFLMWEPYMQASAGQPSLHGNDACMVYWTKGALRRN